MGEISKYLELVQRKPIKLQAIANNTIDKEQDKQYRKPE